MPRRQKKPPKSGEEKKAEEDSSFYIPSYPLARKYRHPNSLSSLNSSSSSSSSSVSSSFSSISPSSSFLLLTATDRDATSHLLSLFPLSIYIPLSFTCHTFHTQLSPLISQACKQYLSSSSIVKDFSLSLSFLALSACDLRSGKALLPQEQAISILGLTKKDILELKSAQHPVTDHPFISYVNFLRPEVRYDTNPFPLLPAIKAAHKRYGNSYSLYAIQNAEREKKEKAVAAQLTLVLGEQEKRREELLAALIQQSLSYEDNAAAFDKWIIAHKHSYDYHFSAPALAISTAKMKYLNEYTDYKEEVQRLKEEKRIMESKEIKQEQEKKEGNQPYDRFGRTTFGSSLPQAKKKKEESSFLSVEEIVKQKLGIDWDEIILHKWPWQAEEAEKKEEQVPAKKMTKKRNGEIAIPEPVPGSKKRKGKA